MLELLNNYAHGYVAVPVIRSCQQHGLFEALPLHEPRAVDDICALLGANPGHLKVALVLLESIGWVVSDAAGGLIKTEKAELRHRLPGGVQDLLEFPFDAYIEGKSGAADLARWFQASAIRWEIGDETLAQFLDGMMAIPLLLALHERNLLTADESGAPRFATAGLLHGNEIAGFFREKGWLESRGTALAYTPCGRFMTDRIYITATVASYRPMLARISEVIFGDCRAVFARDGAGAERHVDRRLNVKGSGFQHEKYFSDLEDTIVSIFDQPNFDEQPKYVADMGCGDGTLLKRIYEVIRDKTARGRVLAQYPVKLLGCDINDKALHETSLTLQGLDHWVMKADIGNPEQLIVDLQARGIADPEAILHVRSFLDHDRPYLAPRDAAAAAARERTAGKAVHVGRDGKAIPAGAVMQSLVEHLQRWSSAVGRYGLAVLEVHCLSPETIFKYLDKCESLHFDAYHRFSHQYLVTADQFILAAAEVGLFPSPTGSRRYPKVFPFTRITLNHFRQRPYRVRHARHDDLAALAHLEGGWKFAHRQSTGEEIVQRLADYPEGQIVFEREGRVLGVAYTQRLLMRDGAIGKQDESNTRWRHAATGNTIELLYVTVAPSVEESWAREWLEFVESWSRLKPGCESFVGQDRLLRQQQLGGAIPTLPFLPSALATTIRRVVLDAKGLRDTEAPESELEEFGVEMLLTAFQAIGLPDLVARGPMPSSQLIARLGILPRYERLFHALVKMLERRGRLRCDGDRVASMDRPSFTADDLPRAMREFAAEFRQRHPDFQPFLKLMLRCVEFYGDVLTGKKEANDVVFPGGDVDLFAGIFKGNAAADYFNGLVAEIVAAKVEQCKGQRCDILEVGAGTGGTTGPVLRRLDGFGDRLSFCYTDISSTFTRSGEKLFGPGRPWMRFERLNIEEDLGTQGFEPASFDIVYAANVLHDTRQLKKTLGQVRSLLKPGGLLVLNEYTQMKDLLLLTGGLLHGWWLFEDTENRLDGSCLLSIPLWQSILAACGFQECHGIGLPDETDPRKSRQGVIVAVQPEAVAAAQALAPDNLDDVLRDAVHEILGDRRIKAFSPDVPLMECGLDSLELLELRALIGKKLGVELEASFFFQYSTIDKVAAYFRKQSLGAKKKELPESIVRPPAPASQPPRVTPLASGNGGVAVIGVALRFPGGIGTAADYWKLLRTGGSAIGPAASSRWSWPAEIDIEGEKAYLARGGFLERIDEFDASFFRLSPREAELLDPQQRFLLELSWAAMEDAGYRPSSLRGSRTGVYIGACHFDYRGLLEETGGPVNALLSTGTAGSLLANRISYLHDFQGPSILFDTACSSSLVALTEAVQAIRSGRCAQALVGGVNLICSTTNTLAYDHAQMLSRDGDCYPFDARAKGYVRGEGGAVLLLKDLDAAMRDRDAIYAVVRGAAVNHGGEASSLTAPNPVAQARVIRAALDDAGIAPETIGYVEAHGTGTPLGDPIEVEGLNEALSGPNAVARGCGLGSVKSTLGHLEGAAGLAGFIKVLLCLRHRAIPPSRNFQSLNPEIRLGRSFFIADRLTEWAPRCDESGVPLLRRGGVSAFGFGGANAHAILEEYIEEVGENTERQSAIVPFSAKSPEALRQFVERTASFLRGAKFDGTLPALANVAYTLQIGRESMAHRLAFVAADSAELLSQLDRFCAGSSAMGPWLVSSADRASSAMADLLGGEAGREFVARLIRDSELNKLARLWVEGLDLDWAQFYPDAKPSRLHLPTYPFARDRFWAPDRSSDRARRDRTPRSDFVPHALLQEDLSNGPETRFAATFYGDEFFFADHQVDGRRVLPGVAQLEMAVLGARKIWGGNDGLRLTDVFWTKPVVIDPPALTVNLTLSRNTENGAAFQIGPPSADGQTPYSQGRLHRGTLDPMPELDVSRAQAGCQPVTAERFYARFREIGIDYGPGQRAVETFHIGADSGLAKLALPASSASAGRFFLHPSMMDSALQAGVAVLLGFGQDNHTGARTPLLPFALDALDVFAGTSQTMWAAVRVDRQTATARFDVDLYDERGRICVRFRGVQTRPLPSERAANGMHGRLASTGVSLFSPAWEPIRVSRSSSPDVGSRIALVGGTDRFRAELQRRYPASEILSIHAHDSIEAIAAALERHGKIEHLLWAPQDPLPQNCADEALIAAQAGGVRLCFRIVKALHRLGYEQRDLQWTLLTYRAQRVGASDKIEPAHASLHGFAGALAKEYPRWKVRALDLDSDGMLPIGEWMNVLPEASGETLAWRGGQWHRQELIPIDFSSTRSALPYRRGGVYVVIGGAGGIGTVWSEWMARTWGAQIVWIGRRPLDADIREKIAAIGKSGPAPFYISADATDRGSLTRAYADITSRFSQVHGVVHSALVLLDQSLAHMDEARFVAALAAKVDISVRIAQVFRDASLDFALFFSSIAAFSKTAGQSNYAAGCAFKDAFAARMGQEWSCPVKVLNWGYWGSVGRVATDEYRDLMKADGIGSIEPTEGMAALDELLASPVTQLAAIKLIEADDAEPFETPAEVAAV